MFRTLSNSVGRAAAIVVTTFTVAFLLSPSRSNGATTSTLYNASQFPVQFYLKWANRPESELLTLDPGQALHAWSPDNGVPLSIRFNDNPNGPVREESYRLDTESGVPQWLAGAYSCFGNAPNNLVQLVHMKQSSQNQPQHIGQSMGAISSGNVNGNKIDGTVAGAAVGAGVAGYFTDGNPDAIAAGSQLGHVIGGGTPAIKQAAQSALKDLGL